MTRTKTLVGLLLVFMLAVVAGVEGERLVNLLRDGQPVVPPEQIDTTDFDQFRAVYDESIDDFRNQSLQDARRLADEFVATAKKRARQDDKVRVHIRCGTPEAAQEVLRLVHLRGFTAAYVPERNWNDEVWFSWPED